ncbi:hypothetical protein NMY22_g8490 [Coprinellus aureogranulatus]|nr:hypothetical protein NMY22_g8490 [Coprinellus aureogranulatus]
MTQLLVNSRAGLDSESYHKKIAQRLLELAEEARILKMAHNEAVPIHLLPAEILSNIFAILAASAEDYIWIPITWVCRHWRTVALDCVALWTRLPFLNPNFTTVALSRTKGAPISINPKSAVNLQKCTETVADILSRPERLRSVDLRGFSFSLSPILSKCSEAPPALVLESLRLRCERPWRHYLMGDSDDENEDEVDDFSGLDFSSFLKGGTPALQNLELVSCGVAWNALPLASSLTRLCLSDSHRSGAHRPTLTNFLGSLKETQNLSTLNLSFFLPADGQKSTPAQGLLRTAERAVLPALNVVSLYDRVASPQGFFDAVEIPDARTLTIRFCSSSLTAEDIGRFLSSLHSSWRNAANQIQHVLGRPVTTLSIKYSDLYSDEDEDDDVEEPPAFPRLGDAMSTLTFTFRHDAHDSTPRPQLGLTFEQYNPILSTLLAISKERLNLRSSLRTLFIESIDYLPQAEWIRLFLQSPKLSLIIFAASSQPFYFFLETFEADPAFRHEGDDSTAANRKKKI